MTTLFVPSSQSHWYTPDGKPAYDADMRKARKEGLYPSVTTVLRLWPKPMLESWKLTQAVLAALTLPAIEGEDLDSRAKRVAEDSQKQVSAAAEWGTRFHALVEEYSIQGTVSQVAQAPDLAPHWEQYKAWHDANVDWVSGVEEILVDRELGVAGRMDFRFRMKGDSELTLFDVKSRSVRNGKAVYYDEQIIQLVAYQNMTPPIQRPQRLGSILINRNSADPPYVKIWPDAAILKAREQWLAVVAFWKAVNRWQ